jgi:hypothetical protein
MSFIIPRIDPIELECDGVRILFPRVDFRKRVGFALDAVNRMEGVTGEHTGLTHEWGEPAALKDADGGECVLRLESMIVPGQSRRRLRG